MNKKQSTSNFLTPPGVGFITGRGGLFLFSGFNTMKTCTKCKHALPETFFYKQAVTKDGLQSHCKECGKKGGIEWRKANSERHRAVRQAYRVSHRNETNKYRRIYYVAHQNEINEISRRHYAENREDIVCYTRQYYQEHKKERLAQNKVDSAKKSGILIPQPCENCSSTENIHGHHDDYDKPLDVRWLCSSCHGRLHAEQRRLA